MAFTLPELRAELEVLGYGGVPDHVMLNSLAQLNFGIPSSGKAKLDLEDRSSREGICGRIPPSRLDGSPVPGDREFSTSKKKRSFGRKGLDAVCFTPDFATELDEMRKMLVNMEGTKEKLFGSMSTPKRAGKGIGLAEEHEHYVGKLMDTWRIVGRTMRAERSKLPVVREERLSQFQRGQNSKHCTDQLGKENSRLTISIDSDSERELAARLYADGCNNQPDCVNACEKGLNQREGLNVDKGPLPSVHHQIDMVDGEDPEEKIGIAISSEQGSDYVSEEERVMDVEDASSTRPVLTRRGSTSAISPGASYQQGEMLYPETFSDRCQDSDQFSNVKKDPPPHQDSETNPLPSPPPPRPTPKAVLDELSALSNEQFLASLERSLDRLDPQDTIDQEAFANFNKRLAHATAQSHVSLHRRAARPVETENPIDSSVSVLKTPDRRGVSNHSPLNDRSNIRAVEDSPQKCSKPVVKIKEFRSPDTPKNTAAVTLKRSRSSRDATGSEGGETSGSSLAKFTEDRADSCLGAKKTPLSARKTKSKKVLWQSLPDCSPSPRVHRRNCSASDASHLDIPSLSLSPIKVGEAASPRKSFNREQSCAAIVLPEHRLGTCSVCPHGRKNSDASRSPFSKCIDSSSSEFETSPKQKSSSRKEVGASPKQKLPLRKGSGPSGIYTPLFDQKKNVTNSKVLFKGIRVIPPMEFASEGPRQADRRAASASASLRSSTESAQSSGPQRAPSSQSSKSTSGSSPYAKRSALNSPFGSRSSTSEGTGTPGVPWRGGKVDRVARFAEMQNLWKKDKFLEKSSKRKPQSFHRIFARLHLSHERYTAAYRERVLVDMRPRTEPAPFVVPSYKASDRVKNTGAFPLH